MTDSRQGGIDRLVFEVDDTKYDPDFLGFLGDDWDVWGWLHIVNMRHRHTRHFLRFADLSHLSPGRFRVSSNPNNFDTFGDYCRFLHLLFPGARLANAQIKAVDLNVDLPADYAETIGALDVRKAKNYSGYLNGFEHGGKINGLNFGSRNCRTTIYDKSKETTHSLKHLPPWCVRVFSTPPKNWTRIEVKFSGNKLPVKTLGEMKTRLASCAPFDHLILYDVQALSASIKAQDGTPGIAAFKLWLPLVGYAIARKQLDASGHFRSRIERKLNLKKSLADPNKIFRHSITSYLD